MEENNISQLADDFEEFKKIKKFQKHIKTEYEKYFEKWYGDDKTINKAKLLVLIDENGFTSGYCKCCKTIIISQNSGNLEDIESTNILFHEKDWPSWKKELIHEMLHEYQDKVNFKTIQQGIDLFHEFQETPAKPKISTKYHDLGFEGAGHDERYYTLLCIFSEQFNLSAIELKKQL